MTLALGCSTTKDLQPFTVVEKTPPESDSPATGQVGQSTTPSDRELNTIVVMLGTGTPNPVPERSGPAVAVIAVPLWLEVLRPQYGLTTELRPLDVATLIAKSFIGIAEHVTIGPWPPPGPASETAEDGQEAQRSGHGLKGSRSSRGANRVEMPRT